MYNGLEVDMLSLGDADCIVVTQWNQLGSTRVLIDGGSSSDTAKVKDFLFARGYTAFYAAVCSHPHHDHASGLIQLLAEPRLHFATGWMHDIRNHVGSAALGQSSSGTSSEAKDLKQVIETTRELDSAFRARGITPVEPFAGSIISAFPFLTVLGPSREYYSKVVSDLTKTEDVFLSAFAAAVATWGESYKPAYGAQGMLAALSGVQPSSPSPLAGLLSRSAVRENPVTQPFNNTSVILGIESYGHRLLFTADAGTDALDCVGTEWQGIRWMQVPHHGSDGNLSQQNIERFRPKTAFVSACGDSSHPSRAIVSGLIKAGGQVFSTHQNPNLQFYLGNVPPRNDYGPAVPMKGTGSPEPLDAWVKLLMGGN